MHRIFYRFFANNAEIFEDSIPFLSSVMSMRRYDATANILTRAAGLINTPAERTVMAMHMGTNFCLRIFFLGAVEIHVSGLCKCPITGFRRRLCGELRVRD